MPFTLEIVNESRRKIRRTSLALIQKLTLKAGPHDKEGYCKIHSIEGPGVQAGCEEVWMSSDRPSIRTAVDETASVVMRIPPIPPTRLGSGCSIIDVQYMLKVRPGMS